MSQAIITITSPFGISMRSSSIATIGTILSKATVNELLFRIVSKNTSQFFIASLNRTHCS